MSDATLLVALSSALHSAPGRPLLTTYDERSGERVELSVATFDNWVCKLANLFGAEWELDAGDLVVVRLTKPWHLVAATVAAWTAGLTVTFDPTLSAAVPIGPWDDFAHDVPGQADVLVMPRLVRATDPALLESSGTSTHADLVIRGADSAATMELHPGGRLATNLDPTTVAGLDATVLAPLATGSSVVHVMGGSPERRERIAEQERATCTRWDSTTHPA